MRKKKSRKQTVLSRNSSAATPTKMDAAWTKKQLKRSPPRSKSSSSSGNKITALGFVAVDVLFFVCLLLFLF